MNVGFKYRESGKLPKVKVPGTFYYLAKGGDKDELWFCFSDTLIKRVDNELLNADEVNAVIIVPNMLFHLIITNNITYSLDSVLFNFQRTSLLITSQ